MCGLIDLDGKLKLPKNKIIQQHLTPTVKPKDTPMKKNGGKENLSPDPEIDPMIFEGNFPILKLHRVDERPLSGIVFDFSSLCYTLF